MPCDVMDRDQRFIAGESESLGGFDANQQGTDQPGPESNRKRVYIVERQSMTDQEIVNHGNQALNVGAGGDLRNHPAEAGVELNLGSDNVGQDVTPVFDEGDGCFIT